MCHRKLLAFPFVVVQAPFARLYLRPYTVSTSLFEKRGYSKQIPQERDFENTIILFVFAGRGLCFLPEALF
jgi:hypothetical protein